VQLLSEMHDTIAGKGEPRMPPLEELSKVLAFRPHPGPTPDPASLLQFVVELEQPAITQQAFGAYLQHSAEVLQSQVKFVQALQHAVSVQTKAGGA
jgi:hypothetical protein